MSIYLGVSVYGTALTDLLNNNNTWTVQNGTLTEISGEGCYQLTASSTNTCYSYKNLNAPVPLSGIGTAGNTQYLYARAKVWSNTSNTGYPLFSDFYYTSSSSSSGTAGRITQSYIVGKTTAIDATFPKGRWCTISCIIPTYLGSTGYREAAVGVQMYENAKNDYIKFKDLFCVEVTSLFNGVPTRQECDKKISFYNNNVYLENDDGTTTILNNKLITNIYIGNSNNTAKRVISGYIGDVNNTPKIFFDNRGVKKFFESLAVVTDISRNRTTASSLSLTYSDYTSGLYYLFSVYYGQLKLYKVKNGTLTLTPLNTPGTEGSVYKRTLYSTWNLSTDGSSAASVYGGALVLTTSNLSEDYVDSLLENVVTYPVNGYDYSQLATVSYTTQNSAINYFLPVRYGNIGDAGNVSNRTGFSLWDKNGNKIMQLNNSYLGATYSNGTLSIGDVYGGSIIGFREVFTYKTAKIKTSANGTPIDFYFPAGETWNRFVISSVNSNSLFAFETSTFGQTSERDKLQYNGTYIKYNNSYIIRKDYDEIQ